MAGIWWSAAWSGASARAEAAQPHISQSPSVIALPVIVVAGLDPAILVRQAHHEDLILSLSKDGLPGQARQWQEQEMELDL
jgi:hypothetical protein